MKNIVQLIAAFLFAIICSFCTLILLIQEDAAFKQKLQSSIATTFSRAFACNFETEVTHVNFFTGKIILKNCVARDPEHAQAWSWQAPQIDINIAHIRSCTQKKIIAHLVIHDINMATTYDQEQLAIMPHLKKLITPGAYALPVEVAKISIHKGSCTTQHAATTCSISLHGHAELKADQKGAVYLFNTMLNHGFVTYNDTKLVDALAGNITGKFVVRTADPETKSSISLNGSCKLMQQPEDDKLCKVYGTWSPQAAQLNFETHTQQIQGQIALDKNHNSCTAKVTIPAAYALACAFIPTKKIAGHCSASITTTFEQPLKNIALTLAIDQLSYQNIKLPSVHLQMQHQDNKLQGSLVAQHNHQQIVAGTCTYDITGKHATCTLKNSKNITLPESWFVPAQTAHLSCTVTPGSAELYGEYESTFTNSVTQEQKKLNGIVHITPEHCIAQGTGDQFTYDFLAGFKPFFHLEYADCYLKKEPVINLQAESAHTFAGTINYPLLRFIANAGGVHLPGEGIVHLKGTRDKKQFTLLVKLEKGNIRLPYTYNLLQDMQGAIVFDAEKHAVSLHDFSLNLHKGSMLCSHAQVYLNDQFELAYAHVPVTIHNCFLGMNKDLFALFSGALTFEYKKNSAAHLSGCMTLDRSHIRNNIFSEEFYKNIFGRKMATPLVSGMDITTNITIMTCSPVRVKTAFLEAAAHAHIQLNGSLANPAITGTIAIVHGSFLFPYKPLFIKRGKIYFLPQQIDDPVIDILAENKIKKYSVRMTVDGTAKNSHISFDATPSLQEEHIIALLLGGSEDGSLFLAMPTSVMNSIEQLVFGPAESSSQFQRALKNLFAPLKNLRITPSFSDQSARGGVRGSLVIDVNDRLRAMIEQNFSLPEDVVIQVEYDLSDDSRIRVMRDERGDLGGELETGWKF